MRILVVNYEYPPVGGGGGVFSRDLSEELAKEHRVDVLTSGFGGLPDRETSGKVNIFRVRVPGRRSAQAASLLSLVSFLPAGIAAGRKLVLNGNYDLINTHFAVPTGPVGMVLAKHGGIPNVLSIHGGDIYDPTKSTSPHRNALLRYTVRKVMRRADAVVAQSSNTRDNAERIYRPGRDIDIIPLGIPPVELPETSREELGMSPDRTYMISIGRFVERKGYRYLITAVSRLVKGGMDAGLVLIGGGPQGNELIRLAKDLGISDRVIFAGTVDDVLKLKYLRMSDIYALSSVHEGFGIVLLEAMSCGLPVIATNEGGQTDIIRENVNGLLVPPRNAEELAKAAHTMISDPDLARRLAGNNRTAFRQYTIKNTADKYLELFERILNTS